MHLLNNFSTGHSVWYGEHKHEILNLKILSPPFIGLGLSDLIYKVRVPLTCLTMLLGRKWIEPAVLSLAMQSLPESSRQLLKYCTALKEWPSVAWQATEMPSGGQLQPRRAPWTTQCGELDTALHVRHTLLCVTHAWEGPRERQSSQTKCPLKQPF